MKRIQVTSSDLASIGYDEEIQTLEAEFIKDHSIYQYFKVPVVVYEGLLATNKRGESVGKYFNQYVKKAGYQYKKL